MSSRPMTRWSLSISERTDRAVRTFLAQTGGKKGDLSKLVERAVRQLIFRETVKEIQDRNAPLDQKEIMDMVDEAVEWARARRS